jgi:hypothetical protein
MNDSGQQHTEREFSGKAGNAFPKNRPLFIKRRLFFSFLALTTFGAAQILSSFPNLVETVFTNGVGQWLPRTLSQITGWAPFSVVEIASTLLAILFARDIIVSIIDATRGRRRLSNVLACGVLKTLGTIGIVVTVFYGAWGFNYSRADLIHRLRWEAFAEKALAAPDVEKLAHLCEETVNAGNEEYRALFHKEDLGEPSAPKESINNIDAAIERSYACVTKRLKLHSTFAAPRGRAKPLQISPLMSYTLISGFYSPWTGEANYNFDIPLFRQPEVIAHEKAHQRCVASEDEANFFGYLACIHSDDSYVRYSGCVMAQRILLTELSTLDIKRAKEILSKRLPGVQRDADANNAYIAAHTGKASAAGRAVNNAYLKANRVKGGVKSYQRGSRLLLTFAEFNGGSCLPRPEDK